MNLEFLRNKITEKFGTIQQFAEAIDVHRVSVQNWLNKSQKPEDHRFLDIVNALELTEQEVDNLLNVPKVAVVFRKVGRTQSENSIKEKSKDI